MGNFIDMTGKSFGKLTVLYRAADYIQPSGQHKRMWHCICECGKECDVRASDLQSGNTKSCGCFQNESRGKYHFDDLLGKSFGRLTVIERLPNHVTPSGQTKTMWRCKCECGNECSVYATQLRKGKNSCGCTSDNEKRRKEIEKAAQIALRAKNQVEKQKEERLIQAERKKKIQNVIEKALAKQVALKKKEESLKQESLAALYPDIAKEWDYEKNNIEPTQIKASNNSIVWWKCSLGHSYDMRISSRTGKQKCGCPYCSTPAKRVLKGFNDLQTKYPELAKEWHPTKNGDLLPDAVLCGTAKKVWWLGKCGHEYDQKIVIRVKGGGCPYCSHQRFLKGFSDLETTNPEILNEWDYDKNTMLPSEISVGIHKKMWWKCPFGHSYQAYPSSRCGNLHSGCPTCDKENHTSFPEQALFYYVKKYYEDAINSDRNVIGMELDIYIPSLKIAIEYDGRNWHKENKYEQKKNVECNKNGILLIRIREEGLELYDDCYCIVRNDVRSNSSLSKVIRQALYDIDNIKSIDVDVERDSLDIYNSYIRERKSHSLQTEYPDIAKEWHPIKNGDLTAEMVAPNTNKKVWWLGKCGHEWYATVTGRTYMKAGCPKCAGKEIEIGYNDLKTLYPDLCDSWDYVKNDMNSISPETVMPHSDKKVWWKCNVCGNEWFQKIDIVVRSKKRCNSNGCPKCGIKINAKAKYKAVMNIETGEVFESVKAAAAKYNIYASAISGVCRGKTKTAGGYHWKYYIKKP